MSCIGPDRQHNSSGLNKMAGRHSVCDSPQADPPPDNVEQQAPAVNTHPQCVEQRQGTCSPGEIHCLGSGGSTAVFQLVSGSQS